MSDFNIKNFLTEHMDGRGSRYSAQHIAQDMIDGGYAAISEENFDELYDQYTSRFGDPEIKGNMELRAATMDIYKRILRAGTAGGNGRIGAGAKGRGKMEGSGENIGGFDGEDYSGGHDDDDDFDNEYIIPDDDYDEDYIIQNESDQPGRAYQTGYKDGFESDGGPWPKMTTHWGPNKEEYKAGYAQGVKDGTGGPTMPMPESKLREMGVLLANAGIQTTLVETKKQGKAPGAQLKGKETIKNKGVKGYNDAHPASGRLVGEDAGVIQEIEMDDEHRDDGENPAGFGTQSPEDIYRSVMGWDDDDLTDAPYNDFDAEYQDTLHPAPGKYDTDHGLTDPFGIEEELLSELEDWDGEELPDDHEEYDDEDYGMDDEDEYEGDESVTIRGELPENNYWFKTGKLQKESEALEALIPAGGEVEDYKDNPALEKFRRLANIYHDVYNNGSWDEGRGQRGAEMEEIFNLGPGHTIDADDLEEMVDDVTREAWDEQLSKGMVSEEILMEPTTESDDPDDIEYDAHWAALDGDDERSSDLEWDAEFARMDQDDEVEEGMNDDDGDYAYDNWKDKEMELDQAAGYKTRADAESAKRLKRAGARYGEPLSHSDGMYNEDDEDFGVGDVDMGDDIVVGAGDLVQVDSKLGGEATVVAQREGYIVVKLPKGGMKLLRDDEWWIQDDSIGGDDYVDVEGGYEEPDELAFEDQAQVMPQHAQDDRQNHFFSEGYKIMPPMDPKYVERDGLEGPFTTHSGKVLYYDPKAGEYYDPDTDMYVSFDDYQLYDRDPSMIKPDYSKYDKAPGINLPSGGGMGKPRERGRMDENVKFSPYEKKASGPIERGMKKGAKWVKRGFQWGSDDRPNDMVKRHQEYDTDTLKNLQDKPGTWKTGPAKLQQKIIKRNLRKRGERDFEKYMDERADGPVEFGRGYRHDQVHTDLKPDAPSVVDYVMTPNDGKGVVVDSWQNNDGYYVFFEVELIDGEMDGIKKNYHITALQKLSTKKMHGIEENAGRFQDHEHSHEEDRAVFKRQEMDHELRGEERLNNWGIFIGGKFWKAVKNESHASAIVNTLTKKGKDASYKLGVYPLDEGKWDYKDSMKGKGPGYSADGDGGAKNRKNRKAFRKAEKKRKHQAMMRGEKWAQEKVTEGGMPSGVIKSKMRYAEMTDEEFAAQFGERTEENLRQMAWRHGYGKMSPHYWNRVQRGQGLEEALVPFKDGLAPDYQWVDDESGQLFGDDDTMIDPDSGERREKTSQDRHAADRAARPDYWAKKDKQDAEDEAAFRREMDADIQAWQDKRNNPPVKKLGWDAIGDFGDVAGGGGDPIDFLMSKYGFDMESIDAEAVNQGYEDAHEWAGSYSDLPTVGPDGGEMEEGKGTHKKGYKSKGGDYTRPKDAKNARAGAKFDRKKAKKDTKDLAEFDSATIGADDMRQDAGQDREIGNPIEAPEIDQDAELAGMQELIKNVIGNPDQDMEDAIQTMANPEDQGVDTLQQDEIGQLRNLLGMFK